MRKICSRMAPLFLSVWLLLISVSATRTLIPGGQVVGLELGDDTVTVAGFDDHLGTGAKASGLQVGDRIVRVNNRNIHTASDVRRALECSDGTVELEILRGSKSNTVRFSPEITQDGPKLGVYLKQGVTGVGTVTFCDPETGKFGTLGHGVNNARGELVSMVSGNAYDATILSVKKGMRGNPGQLMGALKGTEPIGTLYKNTASGVFGTTEESWQGTPLPLAEAKEIKPGPAIIRSTIQGNAVQEYSVEILKVYPNAQSSGRNMLLHITDPALLETTGGIVQGMSGSPIIQDGKLVGAVTHVLVNDPTTGYGIFIENMLDAAA